MKVDEGKEVEFYSQSYASFYNTTIEKDKSILAVSAAGIGFLITLINFSKEIVIYEYMIFLFAALAFVVTIFTIIHIFGKNADYIIAITTDSDSDKIECYLKLVDNIATCAFGLGVVLSLILGATLSYQNISQKESCNIIKNEVVTMSDDNDNNLSTESMKRAAALKESFSGAARMKQKESQQAAGQGSTGDSGTDASNSTSDTSD